MFLGTPVDDYVANPSSPRCCSCRARTTEKDIFFYINSPGGSVSAGLGIYDTMQYVKCPIATICVGQAASMGAVLLAAGAAGKRKALPNARVMIHQPSGGAQGQSTDIQIQAKEIAAHPRDPQRILAKHTGKPHRDHQQGHRARQLHVRRGGQGLRPGRRGARATAKSR